MERFAEIDCIDLYSFYCQTEMGMLNIIIFMYSKFE